MPTPNITVTGTLYDISGQPAAGTVTFTLTNAGDAIPSVIGTNIILAEAARIAQAAADGTWSITVWGNDQISPANTVYSVAVTLDSQMADEVGSYELNGTGSFALASLIPVTSYALPKLSNLSFQSFSDRLTAAQAGTGSAGTDTILNGDMVWRTLPHSAAVLGTDAMGHVGTSTAIGAAGGLATLDGTGRLPTGQLPAGMVTSVAGRTGNVTLTYTDIANTPAGAPGGLATLDGTGRLPAGQLTVLPALRTLQARTSDVSPQGEVSELVTWTNPFANDAYTVVCSIADPTGCLSIVSWDYVPGGLGITVAVVNNDQAGHVGTIHAIAYPA